MMKSRFLQALLGAGLILTPSLAPAQPPTANKPASHVLAQKGRKFIPAPGGKITRETVIEMTDVKMAVTTPTEKAEGVMYRKDTRISSLQTLEPRKMRYLLEEDKTEGTMKIGAREQPVRGQPGSLLGVPVIIEEEDGRYGTMLDGVTPTAAQSKQLGALEKHWASDDDLEKYGDVPRTPGDKWTGDPMLLAPYANAEKLTGTFTTEFIGIEEFDGKSCALLKSIFDISGAAKDQPPGTKVSLKGEYLTHRSLADQVDLQVKMAAVIKLDINPKPDVSIHGEGKFTATYKAAITHP